jgi:hypothetical protein
LTSNRKEAERLLLLRVLELRKPLSSILHEDLVIYQSFLKDSQPAESWVSADRCKYPRGDARWRPLTGPLSAASQRLTKTILDTMLNWLFSAGYLRGPWRWCDSTPGIQRLESRVICRSRCGTR